MNRMRPAFLEAGLHFFKHRKRVLFVSPIRPVRHEPKGPVSDGIATILSIVEAHPRCSRHDLAVKVLGENIEAPEVAERKSALAADLHYLVHAGHVIEFADRTLDLPLPAKPQLDPAEKSPAGGKKGGEAIIAPADVAAEVEASKAAESTPPPILDQPSVPGAKAEAEGTPAREVESNVEPKELPPTSDSETAADPAYPLFVPASEAPPSVASDPEASGPNPPGSDSSESQPPP
jgi:hypothetical protein